MTTSKTREILMKRILFILMFCTSLAACDGANVEYSKIKQTVGMSKAQVKKLLGKPDNANSMGGRDMWYYNTTHPDTGGPVMCQLIFNGDTVEIVSNC